jgi:hypothetical protein
MGILEAVVCRPLWRIQQKWDERNLDTRPAKWLRTYSYRHRFWGAVLQSTPGFVVAPLLGYLLSGGRGGEVWGIFAVVAALVFIPPLTYYNSWRVRNGLE